MISPTHTHTYGCQHSQFSPDDEPRLRSQFGLEGAKDIVSPLFFVEWKAWRGTLLEANFQVRRAGAAMVWERGKLRSAVQFVGARRNSQIGNGACEVKYLISACESYGTG
jgi:hypothetical protein